MQAGLNYSLYYVMLLYGYSPEINTIFILCRHCTWCDMKNNRILYLNLLRDSMTKLFSEVHSPTLELLHMVVSASFKLCFHNSIMYTKIYFISRYRIWQWGFKLKIKCLVSPDLFMVNVSNVQIVIVLIHITILVLNVLSIIDIRWVRPVILSKISLKEPSLRLFFTWQIFFILTNDHILAKKEI